MKPFILLTFDVEEFDLPLEFGCHISEDDQIRFSAAGLQKLETILSKHNIPATLFTTLYYAEKNQETIKRLAERHEIASHSKYHTPFSDTDPLESREGLEKITGSKIAGFRMPHYRKIDLALLKNAGYSYDSSLNPTIVPGRYNNLLAPRKTYRDQASGLTEVPVSVSPLLRFPLFWLSFKNLPFKFYLDMCRRTLLKDSCLHLYFHPWEFADLGSVKIPGYIKTISGNSLSDRFERLLGELSGSGDFATVSGFIDASTINSGNIS